MKINWFLFMAALLNIAGAIWFAWTGSYKLAGVWLAYSIATGILSTMEG